MSAATRRTLGSVALLVVVVVGYLLFAPADDGPADRSSDPGADRSSDTGSADTIAASDLPDEAEDTLALIDAGGPFPYDEDGSTFQNREGLLPPEPRGTYAEYTVETPGEDDRGPRRIVCIDTDPCWWTADHYASFRLIER